MTRGAARAKNLHGMGQSVLNSSAFKSWLDCPGRLLWLNAIPGAGKTILCSTIIDDLCHQAPSKQLLQSMRRLSIGPTAHSRHAMLRPFSTSVSKCDEAEASPSSNPFLPHNPDPQHVPPPRLETGLEKASNQDLVGSRRRRAALQYTSGIPFEQLPYQCFQEARKILIADREEKLKQIEKDRARIIRLRDSDPALCGGEALKKQRLKDMIDKFERLKLMADINDPLVKRRFEDGLGGLLLTPHHFDRLNKY
jgi:large subunit ribosomal protein L35